MAKANPPITLPIIVTSQSDETRNPHNILLIGEDPAETEMLSDLVREIGQCKVDTMARVQNSFDWIARSNYHLVVLDLSMKDPAAARTQIDGLTLLEQIKRISPVTSVILISDQPDVDEAVAAIRLGAEDYLKKPFNVEAFKLAAKRGLDRKTVFGGDASASSFLTLLNSCQMISASMEQKKIFGIIESYLLQEMKCAHSAIYSLQGEDPIRVDDGVHDDRAMQEVLDIALHASNPLPSMAKSGEIHRVIQRGQLTPALFVFRFNCAGQSDYFCVCLSPDLPKPFDAFENRLRMLRTQIEVTGKNIEHYIGVQHLIYVDDATGLYNTRYLNNVLDREIQNAQATGSSFAVLFLDADKFKSINDTHGHLVGTKILYEMGDQLKKYVRDTDTVFRYGGDEFVAVLSASDLKTAQSVAERIRKSIEKKSFLESEGLNLHFTVSIGIAMFPEHAKSKKEIIDAADQAMYNAKKTARNHVSVATVNSAAEKLVTKGG
jgi:two-component system cell cycle response regulator